MAALLLLPLASLLLGAGASTVQPVTISDIAAAKRAPSPGAFSFFSNHTIYSPKGNETVGYPRVTELSDGSLLATCTLSLRFPQFFPIFKSTDGGASWEWISSDPDDGSPLGLGAQPALLQTSKKFGDYPSGTVLAAGNRMSFDSTNIDLYASTDKGKTWSFVTTIAQGGPPTTKNGGSSIWEPFLMEYNSEVIAYYSDSRDQKHGQKLSHQTSTNLEEWNDAVDDAAYSIYADRPGMTVISYIPPLGQYMLVYEYGRGNRTKGGNRFPDVYKLAADPRAFASAPPLDIEAADSRSNASKILEPGSAPYVVWSPAGGANGTIIMTDANHKKLFINTRGGDAGAWETRDVPQKAGYARALHVMTKYPDHLMIFGAGPYRAKRGEPFSLSVVNVTELVGQGLGKR
ncbi:glycoside hydrolase family 93 protein [Polyplosphaeria fusca]|uniref:Glycoside hydrolase family 93 protein n=1 Tax=Polyplosphaeria fusca TaxID=682080 RepID=A0A9P4QQF8_9PLEO|nr:glycoside hydrolase family 93 protein [Polyplosphaeria fusca]